MRNQQSEYLPIFRFFMASFNDIQQRERGLQQHLTSAQMVMIAIGGAVGTGLFMGSAFAMRLCLGRRCW